MYKITQSNRQFKKKNWFACNRCPICSHLKSVFLRLCTGMFVINIYQCDKWPKIHLVLQAIPPQNSSIKCVACRVVSLQAIRLWTSPYSFTSMKFCAISHTQMLRFGVHQRDTNDTKMVSYTHAYISPLWIVKHAFLFYRIIIVNNENRNYMYVWFKIINVW